MGMQRLNTSTGATLGFLLAGILLGCGKEATGPEAPAAITEADVAGTWHTVVPTPGFIVKVDMEVKADHSMNFSQQYLGLIPGKADSAVDWSYESGTWSLSDNVLTSNKLECRYADTKTYAMKDSACAAPVSKAYSLAIKGNTLTVVEGKAVYVFNRD
ncbi:MAG: hypothetical protein JWP91_3639 [Fibrobacteres bacterium]|nr:hypothetical protein [Fibrobacterota bacterium]